MWNQIKTYIDSGKKLKMRGDQLIYLLGNEHFSGKLLFHNKKRDSIICFNDGEVLYSEEFKSYVEIIFDSLFMISSEQVAGDFKKMSWEEFLFSVVASFPQKIIEKLMTPYVGDYITLKPEAGNYPFIEKDFKLNFQGKNRLSVRSLMPGFSRTLYFLLLTQAAGIMKGAVKDESYRKKDSSKASLESFISEKEKVPDIFTLLNMKRRNKIDKILLKKNYFKIANILHPDKIISVDKVLYDRALDLMGRVNMAYDILKVEDDLDLLFELEEKFGYVKEKLQLENFKEYNTADGKAAFAEKIMEFYIAYSVYKTIYDNTNSFYILKKIVKVLPRVPDEKLPNKEEVTAMYGKIYVQKNIKDLDDTVYIIIAKANEKLGQIQIAIDTLKKYLALANSSNVKKYLERLEFYAKK